MQNRDGRTRRIDRTTRTISVVLAASVVARGIFISEILPDYVPAAVRGATSLAPIGLWSAACLIAAAAVFAGVGFSRTVWAGGLILSSALETALFVSSVYASLAGEDPRAWLGGLSSVPLACIALALIALGPPRPLGIRNGGVAK